MKKIAKIINSPATVNLLVEKYLSVAKLVASRCCRKYYLDEQDALSDSLLGLFKAAQRLDTTKGKESAGYFANYCKNSILDGLRHKIGRKKIGREIRGVDVVHVSISDTFKFESGRDWSVEEVIEDTCSTNIHSILEKHHLTNIITTLVDDSTRSDLRQRNLKILYLHWVEEYTLKEAGLQCGVSEANISLIVKRARKIMKEMIKI